MHLVGDNVWCLIVVIITPAVRRLLRVIGLPKRPLVVFVGGDLNPPRTSDLNKVIRALPIGSLRYYALYRCLFFDSFSKLSI